jgi:hypothetical protein
MLKTKLVPEPNFFTDNRLAFSLPLPYDYKNCMMFGFFSKIQKPQRFCTIYNILLFMIFYSRYGIGKKPVFFKPETCNLKPETSIT